MASRSTASANARRTRTSVVGRAAAVVQEQRAVHADWRPDEPRLGRAQVSRAVPRHVVDGVQGPPGQRRQPRVAVGKEFEAERRGPSRVTPVPLEALHCQVDAGPVAEEAEWAGSRRRDVGASPSSGHGPGRGDAPAGMGELLEQPVVGHLGGDIDRVLVDGHRRPWSEADHVRSLAPAVHGADDGRGVERRAVVEPHAAPQPESPRVRPTVLPRLGEEGLKAEVGGEREEGLENGSGGEGEDPALLHREPRQMAGDSAR
jgi:hypothetical protein